MDSLNSTQLPKYSGHINLSDFLDAVQVFKAKNKDFVLATLVHSVGSTPQDPGARALISQVGLEFGTVGGGKIEARVIATALELLKNPVQKCAFFQWNLQKDIGMTCGGVVSFFFEICRAERPWKIAVFGAGHVAQELVRLLILLDCEVLCVDSRADWINKLPQSPKLRTLCTSDLAEVVAQLHPNTFVATMTMGHCSDLPILVEAMMKHSFPYLGTIGSDIKAGILKKELRNAGVPESVLSNFRCPIGEEFGTNAPIEIAFSIVSQLIRERERLEF
ncbi:MAG: XdhC family protein [Bdellovibrionia bacterium]